MKLIRTEDAAGQVLCHDITQILPGEFKGPRFRKGHIVQPEDIPVLLSIGKENLYVWEKTPGILHEDEAAALLYRAAAGRNIHGTEPKEGKIELIADCDGLLKIDRAALLAVNRTPQMMIATIHGDMPVKKGAKLAGTRIIPLVIEQEKMDAMQKAAGDKPILNVLPFHQKKFAVITTGSEVFKGRIEDKFTPILERKLAEYGCEMVFHKVCDDDPAGITAAILEAKAAGKIGHIGVTAHEVATFEMALDMDWVETIMFPYNFVELQAADLIKKCAEKGKGFICMKPLAGGAIENAPLAMRFIASNKDITVNIPGMASEDELKQNVAAACDPAPLSEEELREVQNIRDTLGNQFCRRCNYCQPCTMGINISFCFTINGYLTRYGLKDWAIGRYKGMAVEPNACIECGMCESRCPYHLPIIEMLKDVYSNFQKEMK